MKKKQKLEKLNLEKFKKNQLTKDETITLKGGLKNINITYTDCQNSGGNNWDCGDSSVD